MVDLIHHDSLQDFLTNINSEYPLVSKKKIYYYNIPCGFDIEVSSTYINEEKVAFMYLWCMGINGHTVCGRTWTEFITLLDNITVLLDISLERRLVIYVHNLGYEFQFMRKYFEWEEVFSLDKREPIVAVTDKGIEFRCSYALTGYSLEKVGEHLRNHNVRKMTGTVDYSIIRTSESVIEPVVYEYQICDVQVVMCHISEQLNQGYTIANIPKTKTGYVRQYVKRFVLNNRKERYVARTYRQLIKSLTLTTEEYLLLKKLFTGGFTHASWTKSGLVLNNVDSDDFTSSYPYVMVSEKFPMSKGEKMTSFTKDEFYGYLKSHCCMFILELLYVEPSFYWEHWISKSKCLEIINGRYDNGRVISADYIKIVCNEVDFGVIQKFYKYEHYHISDLWIYRKEYLPKEFIQAVLSLYRDKTTLKGIEGYEVEYQNGKENLNSCSGMCVTDVVRDIITYDKEWKSEKADINKAIDDYNSNKGRFLFYPWGVWITSYARRNLASGILELKEDYCYSDTDSTKYLNRDKHIRYFTEYNKMVRAKLKIVSETYGIPMSDFEPETKDGVKKLIGVWEHETKNEIYTRFKTLGAKRYMIEQNGNVGITVSGLNKKKTVPYIMEQDTDPFKFFSDGMKIPKGYTGKQIHTYIDEHIDGYVKDYTGKICHVHEESCVHLENSEYELGITEDYKTLLGIATETFINVK